MDSHTHMEFSDQQLGGSRVWGYLGFTPTTQFSSQINIFYGEPWVCATIAVHPVPAALHASEASLRLKETWHTQGLVHRHLFVMKGLILSLVSDGAEKGMSSWKQALTSGFI